MRQGVQDNSASYRQFRDKTLPVGSVHFRCHKHSIHTGCSHNFIQPLVNGDQASGKFQSWQRYLDMWMPSRTKSCASVLTPGGFATSTPADVSAVQMSSQSSCLLICMPLESGEVRMSASKLTVGGPSNSWSRLAGSAMHSHCPQTLLGLYAGNQQQAY